MAAWIWVVIAVVVVLVVLALVAAAARRRRSAALRDHFGPEYERTVRARDSRRAAEADLLERERQRAQLDIRPLPEPARARYAEQWGLLQQSFVDQPVNAVVSADGLVRTVMAEEGYPVHDFEAQSGLVSVDHPHVVENFRVARDIHERARAQRASTEDLREAMLRYRSLFDELLHTGVAGGSPAAGGATGSTAGSDGYPAADARGGRSGGGPGW